MRHTPFPGCHVGAWQRWPVISLSLVLILAACEVRRPLEPTEPPVDAGAAFIAIAPKEATLTGIGDKITLLATAETATGAKVSSSNVSWASLQPAVATVSTGGVVTAAGEGTARITAQYQSAADTATIYVVPGSPNIVVSPEEATLEGIGNIISLRAVARTSTGDTVPSANLTWTSLQPSVATVNTSGLVTAVSEGTAQITVAYQGIADTATIHVKAGPLPPPPPPTNEQWDRVLANVTIQGDVIVPAGEKWLIGPAVQIAGNLRTEGGTIAMRPRSSLRFLGANPDEYVGGGMTYAPEFARDIGLWIGDQGVLDIQGTAKTGWNRTGTDPTWKADDEYWITPTAVGDYEPRRWYPGNAIPQIDPRVPAAEVINVTRDIVIEGPGHIHIHSQRPQRIEYVQLRRMGVSSALHGGQVLGRYALHLHFSVDGSRGTIIRGVAAVNCEGRVYVPHVSHGITMIDNVSVNSWGSGLFWDEADRTNDLTIDRLLITGVLMPRAVSGATSREAAIENRGGDRMKISNSVASGARGSAQAHGFTWPSIADNDGPAMWDFANNVAHNNQGAGVRFWFNNNAPHLVEQSIAYRNGLAGIETGAYHNAIRYEDMLLLDNGILHHSASRLSGSDGNTVSDGRGAFYDRLAIYASEGPAIETGRMRLAGNTRVEWVDCVLQAGPGAPKVTVGTAENPVLVLFRRCGVIPDDIVFSGSIPNGSSVLIEHEDGRQWEIRMENGVKVVRQIK